MDIPAKLMKFKVPIFFGTFLSVFILFLIYVAPSFLDILKYFWPLLVSTALFLVAIVVFGRISPPQTEASGEKAGEGILDYVAGQPENLQPQEGYEEEYFEDEKAASASSAKGKEKAESDNE